MADVVTMGGQPYDAKLEAIELRAKVLGEIFRLVVTHPEGILFNEAFQGCLEMTGLVEEQVGPDIINGAFLLEARGMVHFSTSDDGGGVRSINAETKLIPVGAVRDFIAADF